MSEHNRALLEQYRRNLQVLEHQAANYAPADLPLKLHNNLEAVRSQIADLERGTIPILEQPPNRKAGILIDRSHGQRRWPRAGLRSLFDSDLAHIAALATAPLHEPTSHLGSITHAAQLDPTRLVHWRGMIVAMPWRQQMAEATCSAIAAWVREGGRLLLLGYEMGERHHGSNINALAYLFGLHFNADIVAPPDRQPTEKPYDDQIIFRGACLHQHSVLAGVETLKLANLCTITFDPGARIIIGLHSADQANPQIAWLQPDDAAYPDGTLATPGKRRYDAIAVNKLSCVMAQAAQGLCGNGAVLALGTWDLFGPNGAFMQGADNLLLWRNLLNWLAGTD